MFDTAGTMLTMMVFTSIDLLISSLRLLRLVQSKTRDRIRHNKIKITTATMIMSRHCCHPGYH
jgi:hypothetical protein